MSSGNTPTGFNPNFPGAANGTAPLVPPGGYYPQTDFLPPPGLSATIAARSGMPGSQSATHLKTGKIQSNTKAGIQKLSKSKPSTSSGVKASVGSNSNSGNKTSTKTSSSSNKSGVSLVTASRQVPGNTALEFNTTKQNQMISQCDYIDRTIWSTRVLWGGNAVNGFLRATATAQRIKKQRARQNNSTKMSRAAKAASASASGGTSNILSPTGEDDKKGLTAMGSAGLPNANTKSNPVSTSSGTSGAKTKEIFNQYEEELLKKEIMNPRTAKKIEGGIGSRAHLLCDRLQRIKKCFVRYRSFIVTIPTPTFESRA
mmetsp:Transcript_19122/g.41524  ORF Transcript_19122/g.41524 Transcript_19122/m.41524 type:complete len:315 (+) Transcript_19122:86-1030(+)